MRAGIDPADFIVKMKDVRLRLADMGEEILDDTYACLLYTSPSPRDLSTSRMPSSA